MISGYLHPDIMFRELKLTSVQVSEILAFNNVEPVGEINGYLQNASLMKHLVDIHSSKDSQRYKVIDFLPDWFRPKIKQTGELMKGLIIGAFGGATGDGIVRRKKTPLEKAMYKEYLRQKQRQK